MTEVKLEVTTNSMDTMVDVGDFVMVDDHLCMIARVGYRKYSVIGVVKCNHLFDDDSIKFPMKLDDLKKYWSDYCDTIRIVKSVSLKIEV